MNRRVLSLFCGLVVAACSSGTVSPTPPPSPSVSSDKVAQITKRLEDAWMACLKSSFQVTSTETRDKNQAAEMAFSSCKTEEDALWTDAAEVGTPPSMFAYLKSQAKQVLLGNP
jgi:hypothetical protein